MKFKSILPKEQKWKAISDYLETRDVQECLARF